LSTIGKVVESGACVGCGACSIITDRKIPVAVNSYGVWQADPSGSLHSQRALGSRVCPFADESPNETQIASREFGGLALDPDIGRYLDAFAAQVNDDDYLAGSSSGGLTSWLLQQLLERDLIDGAIHVGSDSKDGLFSYVVSHSREELASRRKSVYYSTSMADAILEIRGNGKRYALVGVPCFITAGRLLALNDEELDSQLSFFVGLVCGHLKSAAFAKLLAWQLGVFPEELAAVDFRVKNLARDAGSYDFAAQNSAGDSRSAPTASLLGGNWGHGLFQLDACNYCDDVFAETADIVFGDAWLPEFVSDWRGHNIVVTRHQTLAQIVDDGVRSGDISIHPLGPARVAESQAGNFRHRREGLKLRLYDDDAAGRWSPRKRVKPSKHIPGHRKRVVRARRAISSASHDLFKNASEVQSLDRFLADIMPFIDAYTKASRVSFLRKSSIWARSRIHRHFCRS
jgi:coenzyme F420 hydrogenase subunit beta